MFIKKELINKIVIAGFLGCWTVSVLASEPYGIVDLLPDSQAKVEFKKALLKAAVDFEIQINCGEVQYPLWASFKMKLERINLDGTCTDVHGTLFYKRFGRLPEDGELYGFTESEYDLGVVDRTWDIVSE